MPLPLAIILTLVALGFLPALFAFSAFNVSGREAAKGEKRERLGKVAAARRC